MLAGILLLAGTAHAATGTIDPYYKYAWGNVAGWINMNPVDGNIVVSDTAITGYAWSANDGWINFSPTNGGVVNNIYGTLSGYAWDETYGWINFTGVTIDTSGVFHGEAQGINNGDSSIINFDCSNCRVVTTWTATTTSSANTNTNTSNIPSTATLGGSSGQEVSIRTTSLPLVEPPPSESQPAAYPPQGSMPAGAPTASLPPSSQTSQKNTSSGGLFGNVLSTIANIPSIVSSSFSPHAATTTATSTQKSQPFLSLKNIVILGVSILMIAVIIAIVFIIH